MQSDDLGLTSVVEQGIRFETGVPVTFRFVRNTEKSPHFGATFQQDLEPAGRYMIHNESPGDVPRGWESGEIAFENPLVLAFNIGGSSRYDDDSWKARLSRHYKATGKELSKKILTDGHDGIVTTGQFTHLGRTTRDTREIVDLRSLRSKNPLERILPCRDRYCACAGEGHPCAGRCRDARSCRCTRCHLCRKLCVEDSVIVDSDGDPVGSCCSRRLDDEGNVRRNGPYEIAEAGEDLARRRIAATSFKDLANFNVEVFTHETDPWKHRDWVGMYIPGTIDSPDGPDVRVNVSHHAALKEADPVQAFADTVCHEMGHALWELLDAESQRLWRASQTAHRWGPEESFADDFMFFVAGRQDEMNDKPLFVKITETEST